MTLGPLRVHFGLPRRPGFGSGRVSRAERRRAGCAGCHRPGAMETARPGLSLVGAGAAPPPASLSLVSAGWCCCRQGAVGMRGDARLLRGTRAWPAEMAAILGSRSWRAWASRALGAALGATQTPLSEHSSRFLTVVDGDRHDTSRPSGNKANLFLLLGVLRPGLGPPVQEGRRALGSRGGPRRRCEGWSSSPVEKGGENWACLAW